jgi:hypothetical protein
VSYQEFFKPANDQLPSVVSRSDLADGLFAVFETATLEETVLFFTNHYQEVVEYARLRAGEVRCCYNMSLLFNPHRLDTRVKGNKYSVFEAMKLRKWCDGLARATLFIGDHKNLLKATVGLGVNGVQWADEFPPWVARDLAKKYKLHPRSQVLDPCAGWGGRMIGFSTVVNHYTGYEPSTRTYAGLTMLSAFLKKMRPHFVGTVHNRPFEDCEIQKGFYDFALTSPPYYDTEEYADEDTNSMIRYKSFDDWCKGFYIPLIENTMVQLKPGATFVINIGSRRYPLNRVLKDTFSSRYKIQQISGGICTGGGLRSNTSDGEAFFEISK